MVIKVKPPLVDLKMCWQGGLARVPWATMVRGHSSCSGESRKAGACSVGMQEVLR